LLDAQPNISILRNRATQVIVLELLPILNPAYPDPAVTTKSVDASSLKVM
jgi:hypothetical protein